MGSALFNNKFARTLCARQQGTGTLTVQLTTANTSASETVTQMYLEKVMWSGNCSVSRGSNVIFSFASGTAGMFDLYGNGMTNQEDPATNVVLTVNDGGSLLVLVGKRNSSNTEY